MPEPKPAKHHFRFSLRALMIAITVVSVLIGLSRLRDGVLLIGALVTLMLFVIGCRSTSRNLRRVAWSYAALGSAISLLFAQLSLAQGYRVAGVWLTPNAAWAGLLIPAALCFVLSGFMIASQGIRQGNPWARLTCTLSALPLPALVLLAASSFFSDYADMIFSNALFVLRGDHGRSFYVGPRGKFEMYHEHGLREGVWRTWDANGIVIRQCEYRDDSPWEGICQLYPMKAWRGEFKQGKPWHGYLETPGTDEANFYIDGVIVTKAEYCRRLGIPDGEHGFIGIDYWLAEPDDADRDTTIETRDAADSEPDPCEPELDNAQR